MGDGAGRGRGFAASRERFYLSDVEASHSGRIGLKLSSISLRNSRPFGHDRATIAPRSDHDHGSIHDH